MEGRPSVDKSACYRVGMTEHMTTASLLPSAARSLSIQLQILAKVPDATVVEALDEVWLFTISSKPAPPSSGKRVAEIGPLSVKAGTKYTAQYMEAIFPPGAQTVPYTHPGPEAHR